ncbi:MAG TPA: HAMP domain-containing sensor histidine kinase [Anaerolineaceae bacterium]|nr:HAMP domain-containing sensor histidine kinase [Anaerolineaceae bacterium]
MDRKLSISMSSPARLALGIALMVAIALLIFTWLMRPSLVDTRLMAIFLTITSILSVIVGYGAYRTGWINRSPRLQVSLLSGYILSSLLTFINVWITARLMFASEHDLLLATVLLLFAGGIATILGTFYTETLTVRITKLNEAAHQIANGNFDIHITDIGRDELAQLAASFNKMAVQLETAERDKKELDTMRRDLVAWVGHDLQTPLASIRAIVEALADGLVDEPETVQRYLHNAKKDIQSLSILIDDLFQMAKIDAGGLKLDLERGSISDLISDTIESFKELAIRSGILLDGLVEPGVDPVLMDVQRISRVLANLVGNAIKYTPAGGSVFIQACVHLGGVKVEVKNTGSAIPAIDLPHIFEQFYRGERSRSRSSGGAGLGLAIAKGIVEAHQGQIGVSSQPDQGTIFFFTLPGH